MAMHPSREKLVGLPALAEQAEKLGYAGYAEYCRVREKASLRKSLEKLSEFISEMKSQPVKRQRAFADWLLTFCFRNPAIIDAFPTVLRRDLVAPIVSKWTSEESDNPKALRWSEDERALMVAARVQPADEIAIGRYAASVMNRIDYATHEPVHYSAEDFGSDMAAIQTVLDLLNQIPEAEFFESTREEALLIKIQLSSTRKKNQPRKGK